jgi:hypothetical protein
MNEYRITKYNPAFRDSGGAYTKNEWIMFAEIGESFEGVVVTQEEYDRVEGAYVNVALSFLREAGISSLRVDGLQNGKKMPLSFSEGGVLSLDQAGDVIRRVLREEFWCRLESTNGFVHIGWDYYMFVGVPHPCPTAQGQAVGVVCRGVHIAIPPR